MICDQRKSRSNTPLKKTKKEKEKEKAKAKAKAKSKSRMGEVLSCAASSILRNEPSPPEQRINGDGAMCLPPLPLKPSSSSKKESPSSMLIPYPTVAATVMILHSISSSRHQRIISDMEQAAKKDAERHHREYQKLHKDANFCVRDLRCKIRGLEQSNEELMELKAHLIRTLESSEKQNEVLSSKMLAMERLRAKETEANSGSYDGAV